MRINNKNSRSIVRFEQFFEQYPGQITFARACASDNSQMSACNGLHINRNWYNIFTSAE